MKLTHNILLEMIEETVRQIGIEYSKKHRGCADIICMDMMFGKLSAEVEVIKNIYIPKKYRKEVKEELLRIINGCPYGRVAFVVYCVSPIFFEGGTATFFTFTPKH